VGLPYAATVPWFRNATTNGNNNSTSASATVPAGVKPGDLLIMGACTGSHDSAAMTNPAGWNIWLNHAEADLQVTLGLWYRVADGSEASSYTSTLSGGNSTHAWVSFMLCYAGVDTVNPDSAFASIDSPAVGANSTNHDNQQAAVGLTGYGPNDVVLQIYGNGNWGGTGTHSMTPPGAPWTTRVNRSQGNGFGSFGNGRNAGMVVVEARGYADTAICTCSNAAGWVCPSVSLSQLSAHAPRLTYTAVQRAAFL
jgi:hypothetical protein